MSEEHCMCLFSFFWSPRSNQINSTYLCVFMYSFAFWSPTSQRNTVCVCFLCWAKPDQPTCVLLCNCSCSGFQRKHCNWKRVHFITLLNSALGFVWPESIWRVQALDGFVVFLMFISSRLFRISLLFGEGSTVHVCFPNFGFRDQLNLHGCCYVIAPVLAFNVNIVTENVFTT